MEQAVTQLHDAHMFEWMKSFFRFPRLSRTTALSNPGTDDRFWQMHDIKSLPHLPISEGLVPPERVSETKGFVTIPPIWQPEGQDQSRFHEVKQQPNIQFKDIENFFTGFWDHLDNNPHRVTAEQVGCYVIDESHSFKDDGVIDVEAREVKEFKALPPPEEP